MKTILLLLFSMVSLLHNSLTATQLSHKYLTHDEQKNTSYIWEINHVNPFEEAIVSWEASRPSQGAFHVDISVYVDDWSPWLNYAYWGATDQYTFHQETDYVKIYQDTLEICDSKATKLRIRISAINQSTLQNFRALHACTSLLNKEDVAYEKDGTSIRLDVSGLSQLALKDDRNDRLCSPTSTTAVLRYLLKTNTISPIDFANQIHDSSFDIYGNWILNTAQASHYLGPDWHCMVARLSDFETILDLLKNDCPIVVSVKGPLPGALLPYESGHLIVVRGYDAETKQVLCMDPAYLKDSDTLVSYSLDAFLTAWNKRSNVCYMFFKA